MATIPRKGKLQLIFDPTGTPVKVDLSCWVRDVSVDQNTDTIDIGTVCAPGATENGVTTQSIVLGLYWDKDLVTALTPHLNAEAELVYQFNDGDADALQARVKYSTLPWGDITPGQPIECELPLAVIDTISYAAVPSYAS